MNYIICYIDGENKTEHLHLKAYNNVRYFCFLGKIQKDNIICEPGAKVKKIRCEKQGKQYLDCKLIDYLLKRKNTKDTFHYIVSKDGDYDKFIDYIRTINGNIVKRIPDLNNF